MHFRFTNNTFISQLFTKIFEVIFLIKMSHCVTIDIQTSSLFTCFASLHCLRIRNVKLFDFISVFNRKLQPFLQVCWVQVCSIKNYSLTSNKTIHNSQILNFCHFIFSLHCIFTITQFKTNIIPVNNNYIWIFLTFIFCSPS